MVDGRLAGRVAVVGRLTGRVVCGGTTGGGVGGVLRRAEPVIMPAMKPRL